MIRPATPADAAAICSIYNPYVLRTPVTFEEEEVGAAEMAARMAEVQREFPWLVLEREGRVAGYAYAGRFRTRCSYRHTAETTVYVEEASAGRGIGSALYGTLIPMLWDLSMHSLVAGIALPNPGSVALHEKFGFRKVAHLAEVGRKFDRWIDVGYWELIGERRAH
jgi:phosphinothricin acetyltransferase